MSITSAFLNARSGLSATSRLVGTISDNVANALTEGYARRETVLDATHFDGYGHGVHVRGTYRSEAAQLTAERRGADAALGQGGVRASAYDEIVSALGAPGEAGALATLTEEFETALVSAASTPSSPTQLTEAMAAASNLVNRITRLAEMNDAARTGADQEIGRQVRFMNDSLHRIEDLNGRIATLDVKHGDTLALQDERARLVDQISEIVPLTTVRRENGELAIFASQGGALLNGRVFELIFEPNAGGVTSGMTLGAPLSSLQQDQGASAGPAEMDAGQGGLLDGGSLSALFEVRDTILTDQRSDLDAFAAELIDRFTTLMPAASLDAGGEGLFVETNPAATTGIASRIALNAAADPAQGGAVWRMRDGLATAIAGPAGFGDYLNAMADAMTQSRAIAGFVSQNAANNLSGIAGEMSSYYAGRENSAESEQAYLTALQTTLAANEIDVVGVNSDEQLQQLMVVEQAYAANAQVMSVIDELMRVILEI